MAVLKPDPLRDLLAIQQQINRLFEERLGANAPRPAREAADAAEVASTWMPAVDAWETADSFHVALELPGLTPDDVSVTVEGRILSVRGERKRPAGSGVSSFHRVEREYGSFVRAFTVPKSVASFDVETRWEHGVLHVTLARPAAKRRSRK